MPYVMGRYMRESGFAYASKAGVRPGHHGFLALLSFKDVPSNAAFLMMVSLPEEAAEATCCSMLRLIFALSSLCMAACLTAAAFLGAAYRLPFLG